LERIGRRLLKKKGKIACHQAVRRGRSKKELKKGKTKFLSDTRVINTLSFQSRGGGEALFRGAQQLRGRRKETTRKSPGDRAILTYTRGSIGGVTSKKKKDDPMLTFWT